MDRLYGVEDGTLRLFSDRLVRGVVFIATRQRQTRAVRRGGMIRDYTFHVEFRPSEHRWKGLEVWSYKHRTPHGVKPGA